MTLPFPVVITGSLYENPDFLFRIVPCCVFSDSFHVEELTFAKYSSSAHTNRIGWNVLKDADATQYSAPHWDEDPPRQYPFILKRNHSLRVGLDLAVPPNYYDGEQTYIRGTASGEGGSSFTFPATLYGITQEGTDDEIWITSTDTLPNSVQTLAPLTTSWEYKKENDSTWKDAGSTTNRLYIVLAEPITSDLHRSVLYHACATEGATDQTTAFLDCWSQFSGPANTETWDGQTLYYYKPGTPAPIAITTNGLLTDGNGQCLAWVDFFTDVIRCHGIDAFGVRVEPIGQDSNEGSFPDDEGIVVKDWNNDNEGTSGDPDYV